MSTQTTAVSNDRSVQRLVTMALFAAILCVSAYISIPLPLPGAPHITMQNFVILLIALLFPSLDAFLIILVWMILGVIGLPVFIGGGSGIGYLLTPYGGYTMVFPLVGLLLPLIRGKVYNRLRYTLAAIAGALLIDIIGMLWLMAASHLTLSAAFLTGFVPFIPLDIVKTVIAAQIVPAFRKIMQ
jgi:biotin transport system substrate-specific component